MKPNVEQVSKSRQSTAFKSNETVKKVTLKDGLAVDPDSQLEGIAHVYRNKNDIYSAVLSLVDIQSGKNSYYKMQILESDDKKKYVCIMFFYWNIRLTLNIQSVVSGIGSSVRGVALEQLLVAINVTDTQLWTIASNCSKSHSKNRLETNGTTERISKKFLERKLCMT